ncbi:unnamed protein product [Thelazia callipaeda]|uniref:Alanine--tRNA ligase n=1 Tax=Thelazia callipaeda TaxID=103827 RepID=A0A0N5D5U3_THECL|nr:unnamed protein product [Thelazia callipaeda]
MDSHFYLVPIWLTVKRVMNQFPPITLLRAWSRAYLHIRYLSAQQVRTSFLQYFEKHDHIYVPSSSVVPEDDSSLTFVSAGMNQFKPLFLGAEYTEGKFAGLRNVVNWQKCIRVGGKHNDFDDVGRDLTHHTFFEMLGNYSFGGYSKAEACRYAWDFLTNVLKIPTNRLYVTYFRGDENMKLEEDFECRDVWINLGVPKDRILGFSSKDNFWEMAETGPCGPCTEIHYDLIGNRDARNLVNSSDATVVEIWNLVFMQFNRDMSSTITKLPKLYIDCGMGFERLVSIVQGLKSSYDTDIFIPFMKIIQEFSKVGKYCGRTGNDDNEKVDTAYRIIADHLRAACIMIADGVKPGSRNRGFLLRRVLRRAALNLTLNLGAERETLSSLVPKFVQTMAVLYESVSSVEKLIAETISSEEQLFWKSFDKGKKLLLQNIAHSPEVLPGEKVWMLSNVHGLPLEIIQQICDKKGLKVDVDGFNQSLEGSQRVQKAQEELWRKIDLKGILSNVNSTDDSGKYNYERIDMGKYEFPKMVGTVMALYDVDGKSVTSLGGGEKGCVIMDSTIFFAEQGGQMYDSGTLRNNLGDVVFSVESVKRRSGYVLHTGEIANNQVVVKGTSLLQSIDSRRRFSLMCGHTVIHILNFSLSRVFGSPVRLLGSFIGPEKLYLDFFIEQVMAVVNEIIESNLTVTVKHISHEDIGCAHKNFSRFDISQGASAAGLFRLITIHSSHLLNQDIIEPCCGTHVLNTGDIGKFVIVGQNARSAGVRRIYAVTGDLAMESILKAEKLNSELILALKNTNDAFVDTRKYIREFHKDLPLPLKPSLYEMIKSIKKRNKRISRELRSLRKN